MDKFSRGRDELRAVRRENRSLLIFVGIFSFFANLLMLTGPIYMLQVYDRVLGSRSIATLIALSAIVAFLFLIMGLMDYTRGRVMARVGANFQDRLDKRVFEAVLRKSAVAPDDTSAKGLRDLEAIQKLLTSPVFTAAFDIPWTPVFLAGIYFFHPLLGITATIGGAILIVVALLNQLYTKNPIQKSLSASFRADRMGDDIRNEAEMIKSLGMSGAAFRRWVIAREQALQEQLRSSDLSGTFTVSTKTFRLFLQSAMLGVGAYVVLLGELTPGAMIAGSILLGRALAPIEQGVGQWSFVVRARRGWDALVELLSLVPPEPKRTELPMPKARLDVQSLTVIPPGEQQAALRAVNFLVNPGEAVGVIGPSGSGKSTLARAVIGAWRPAGGKVRLDGASLDNYDPDTLGQYIGYLPQRVQLFDGTIAENIAKLSLAPDAEKVVAAARKAAAHDMILQFPDGYDTRIGAHSSRLSGGQIQRIGLARALYGDPVLLVLDEPNSNLDNIGSNALNIAIRAMKADQKSVLIMAHRPAAIQECETILVLDAGARTAFGPKDEVLARVVQNHKEIQAAKQPGGVS